MDGPCRSAPVPRADLTSGRGPWCHPTSSARHTWLSRRRCEIWIFGECGADVLHGDPDSVSPTGPTGPLPVICKRGRSGPRNGQERNRSVVRWAVGPGPRLVLWGPGGAAKHRSAARRRRFASGARVGRLGEGSSGGCVGVVGRNARFALFETEGIAGEEHVRVCRSLEPGNQIAKWPTVPPLDQVGELVDEHSVHHPCWRRPQQLGYPDLPCVERAGSPASPLVSRPPDRRSADPVEVAVAEGCGPDRQLGVGGGSVRPVPEHASDQLVDHGLMLAAWHPGGQQDDDPVALPEGRGVLPPTCAGAHLDRRVAGGPVPERGNRRAVGAGSAVGGSATEPVGPVLGLGRGSFVGLGGGGDHRVAPYAAGATVSSRSWVFSQLAPAPSIRQDCE